jgi:sugar transferase (PEP-CTERM/EpsH1 system associated)
LEKKIHERLRSEKIDRIIVFSSAMAGYVPKTLDIPKVIDFVDVDSDKWRLYESLSSFPASWVYRLEAERLARHEEETAKAFDRSIVVSQMESDVLKRRVTDRPVSVIPNGVDLDYFQQGEAEIPSSDPPIIVFTGVMDYFPNVDAVRYFCAEIFPLIRKARPEAQFYIVGRNPAPAVKKLGHLPNVIVTGETPDIRPYLLKAKVAVAPFRIARGVQNKVLEAMAMGLPVVGTTIAFQAFQGEEEKGIRSADDPAEFARETLLLLEEGEFRSQLSVQARRYVERRHRWEDHGRRLELLLQEAIREPESSPQKSKNGHRVTPL